jgi:hypothetical protein
MTPTPETTQALSLILDEHGELCEDSAPFILVRLCKKLERERDEARAEAAKWKANHDNQVALKSAIIQRPDLRDRSERVEALIKERDAIKAEIESMHADINLALIMIEKIKTTIRK